MEPFHAYIDSHSQILVDEYTGDVVQAIQKLQSQCEKITLDDQIRYNRLFQQVVHKEDYSAINYIKIFQQTNALEISWEIVTLTIS